MSADERNPWATRGVATRFEDRFFRVDEHDVVNAAGVPGRYAVVRFKKHGVGVVPIDGEGHTLLVGQWRYPLGRYLWEIPEGGHAPDEKPADAAARELREETGLAARAWRQILAMDMSTALTDERVTAFLAWDLAPAAAAPDPQEVLAVRRLPFAAALDLVVAGEITDAVSVASLLMVERLAARGALPPAVQRLLSRSLG